MPSSITESVSTIQSGVHGGQREEILYAVFTTPVNSIAGSAVCAFRMADIAATFDGAFKHQENMNSNWLPLKNSHVRQSNIYGVVGVGTFPREALSFFTRDRLQIMVLR